MNKLFKILIAVLLITSLTANFLLIRNRQDSYKTFVFNDANTHESYETIHHIKEAQEISTGKGIKVGIIDKYFGIEKHKILYVKGVDFTDSPNNLNLIDEHGYWMATTLKEIAPDVEIYALNARANSPEKTAASIIQSIDWAIKNNLDVLTYSAEQFDPENRKLIDEAVQKAIEHNIITTFIHYTYPDNILPYSFFVKPPSYDREPDIKVYHKDYNVLNTIFYDRYIKSGRNPKSGDEIPYFSISSMSPVLAGVIALIKETNPDLSSNKIKKILSETSKTINYNDREIENVLDAYAAVNYSLNHKTVIE